MFTGQSSRVQFLNWDSLILGICRFETSWQTMILPDLGRKSSIKVGRSRIWRSSLKKKKSRIFQFKCLLRAGAGRDPIGHMEDMKTHVKLETVAAQERNKMNPDPVITNNQRLDTRPGRAWNNSPIKHFYGFFCFSSVTDSRFLEGKEYILFILWVPGTWALQAH